MKTAFITTARLQPTLLGRFHAHTTIKAIFFTMLFLCWQMVAPATQVKSKPLKDLVAESDDVLIVTFTKVDMIDAQGKQLTDPAARTGPGLDNTIRLHLVVKKEGVLKTTAKTPPDNLVVLYPQMWHSSLGSWKSQWNMEEGKEYIFLLKGDDFKPVYPADFMQPLTKRPEIEQLISEAARPQNIPSKPPTP